MKTVVFAYHTIGVIGLQTLKDQGFEIDAIFSHLDDPSEKCWFDSVSEWALENRVQIFFPEDVNAPEWVQKIRALGPDIIFSFYYRRLLCRQILNVPNMGAYNLHGSLLPAYRGRCPLNWVLYNGEKCTGVTLHHMIEKPDAGDIVAQREIPIDFEDTAETLFRKLCIDAKVCLEDTIPLIKDGCASRRAQDLKSGSYFGKRTPEDGKIDWNKPAISIYNLVRAVAAPYPGAFTFLPGRRKIYIWKAYPEEMETPIDRPNGTLLVDNNNVFVKSDVGRLRLLSAGTDEDAAFSKKAIDIFGGCAGMILS